MNEEMWLLLTIATIGAAALGGLWIALQLKKFYL